MKKIETSKKFAIYLIVLFSILIIFLMVMMWKNGSDEYISSLISTVFGQLTTYGIYCAKAYKSKQSEELLKHQKEMSVQGVDNKSDYLHEGETK